MCVLTPRERRTLAVALAQLTASYADEQTRQAIEGWHYWVAHGYQF